MTLDQFNSLDPLVQKYRALGWVLSPLHKLPETDQPISSTESAYGVQSPRMQYPAVINYAFDEDQLKAFECISVARQNHDKVIREALDFVREDMLKEVAAIYSVTSKGAQVPSEIVVKELRVPLF